MTISTPIKKRSLVRPLRIETPEEVAEWYAEKKALSLKCQPIFERLKPELINKYYNWYMAIEPETGEYAISPDQLQVSQPLRDKYPHSRIQVFRINETGVCGTI